MAIEGIYKFLDYFTESDEAVYAGREREIEELLARIQTSETLVLYGRSGLGKTSLLLAGLFPRLKVLGFKPIYVRTLGAAFENLAEAVREQMHSEAERLDTPEADEMAYSMSLLRLLKQGADGRPIVICFDQFEEFFIFENRMEQRLAFATLITSLVRDADTDVRVVFSLREDYLAELDDFRKSLPEVFENEFRLKPLTAFAARQAIVKPLVAAGVEFDRRVVTRLLDLLAPQFDPLLLQIACYELCRRSEMARGGPKALTEKDLDKLGTLESVFSDYVSAAVQITGDSDSALLLRVVLDALISHARTKNPLKFQDLLNGAFVVSEKELLRIIAHLRDCRLVRQASSASSTWYELTHDRLVDPIYSWLEKDRDLFDFKAAREQLKAFTFSEKWRTEADLLSKRLIEGTIEKYNKRFRLNEPQLELLLRSAIASEVAPQYVKYWAERAGAKTANEVLAELLSRDSTTDLYDATLRAVREVPNVSPDVLRIVLTAAIDPSKQVEVRRSAGRVFARVAEAAELEWLKAMLRGSRIERREAFEVLGDLVIEYEYKA